MIKDLGFSLIEALVALLIVALGVLGVVGMQAKALQSSHLAYQRTVATMMAMEANELLWANYSATCPDAGTVKNRWLGIDAGVQTRWLEKLPGNSASDISLISSPVCTYIVTVTWDDERFQDEGVSELTFFSRLPFSPD